MASRMDRYHKDSNAPQGRSIKNKSLYKQIEDLDSYTNIEGVATIEKTNEIDLSKVKEMLKNRENYKKQRQYINLMGKEEKREEKKEIPIEEEKNYDVKDLLSKIKPNEENNNRSLRKEQYEALKKYNAKNRRDNDNKDSDDLKELLNTLVNDDDLNALADTNDVGLLDELKSNTMVGDASSIKKILDEEKQNIKFEEKQRLAIMTAVKKGLLVLTGGHTVEDSEPKFGLAVTGLIDPEKMVRKDGARPGDVLVLTKPLGTGVLNTAHKFRDISPDELELVMRSMEMLNKEASQAMVAMGAKAGTDVTGYGLLGHGLEMAKASHTVFEFEAEAVPLLPGALGAYLRGNVPGGSAANFNYVKPYLQVVGEVAEPILGLMADAQTSGGLLIAIAEEKVTELMKLLPEFLGAPAIIGRVQAKETDDSVFLRVR